MGEGGRGLGVGGGGRGWEQGVGGGGGRREEGREGEGCNACRHSNRGGMQRVEYRHTTSLREECNELRSQSFCSRALISASKWRVFSPC